MSDPTAFLYPFIEEEERDAEALTADLIRSAAAKIELSRTLRATTLDASASMLEEAAAMMAERFGQGGRVFVFGNGGSATDAEGAAHLFGDPPFGRPLPAICLASDPSVITALANDVGFDLVFSRQLAAHAAPHDAVIGFSTSGESANVIHAFEEAARRDLLTIGLAGYEGGAMAASPAVRYCLVVRSDSVHRIQEVQNGLITRLWELVQERLDPGGFS